MPVAVSLSMTDSLLCHSRARSICLFAIISVLAALDFVADQVIMFLVGSVDGFVVHIDDDWLTTLVVIVLLICCWFGC